MLGFLMPLFPVNGVIALATPVILIALYAVIQWNEKGKVEPEPEPIKPPSRVRRIGGQWLMGFLVALVPTLIANIVYFPGYCDIYYWDPFCWFH